MYKNQLQELAQRSCFNLPSYSCIREGPDHAPRFKATVKFNGETFESPTFCSTLRQAEHAAAEVALNTLAERGPSRALAAKVLDETGVYKNLLQETAHRAGLNLPVYTTLRSGPGHVPSFSCIVELAGMSFTGEPARTKKQAQKNAAMAAWSALKRLSRSGSQSVNSSSSSTSETKSNEEQEQVVIARILVSLRPPESNHPVQSDCQHRHQRSVPMQRDVSTPTQSVYPLHFEHWRYPSFSPELAVYHMWHQEQLLQLQNHLLTIPVSPAPPCSPQILPYMQSIFRPDHSLYLPAREQEPVPVAPRLATSIASPSLYVSSHPVPDCVRGRSAVTIQEIHEEKTEESARFSPSVIPDPVLTVHTNADQDIEEPSQVDDKPNSIELENERESAQSDRSQNGQFQWTSHRSVGSSSRSTDLHSQNQHGLDCYGPYHRQHYTERPGSGRSLRPPPPPSTAAASVMIRSARPAYSTRHRPQSFANCIPSPPRMQTGIPSFSLRPMPERMNIGVHPHYMAPPIRIRSVIPVCSAPPPRKMHSSVQEGTLSESRKKEKEPEDVSAATAELSKLQI